MHEDVCRLGQTVQVTVHWEGAKLTSCLLPLADYHTFLRTQVAGCVVGGRLATWTSSGTGRILVEGAGPVQHLEARGNVIGGF